MSAAWGCPSPEAAGAAEARTAPHRAGGYGASLRPVRNWEALVKKYAIMESPC